MAIAFTGFQFSANLGKLSKKVGRNATKGMKRAALAADTALVLSTPRDTGRAAGNWVVSFGKSPVFKVIDVKGFTSAPQAALDRGSDKIKSWNLKLGPIHVTNSLSYIPALENGSSKQAPKGMTRFGIDAARAELKKVKLLR